MTGATLLLAVVVLVVLSFLVPHTGFLILLRVV